MAGSWPSGRSLSGNAIVARVARFGAGVLLSLGEGTSEQRVKSGQVRTLAFWESRSGVRDRVLDLSAWVAGACYHAIGIARLARCIADTAVGA